MTFTHTGDNSCLSLLQQSPGPITLDMHTILSVPGCLLHPPTPFHILWYPPSSPHTLPPTQAPCRVS